MVIVHVIIRQGDVKRVLPRSEAGRRKIRPSNRVILAAEMGHPVRVPRTLRIWHRIAFHSLFAYPKNSSDDFVLPGSQSVFATPDSREKVIRDSISAWIKRRSIVMMVRPAENGVGQRGLFLIRRD